MAAVRLGEEAGAMVEAAAQSRGEEEVGPSLEEVVVEDQTW